MQITPEKPSISNGLDAPERKEAQNGARTSAPIDTPLTHGCSVDVRVLRSQLGNIRKFLRIKKHEALALFASGLIEQLEEISKPSTPESRRQSLLASFPVRLKQFHRQVAQTFRVEK